MNTSDLSRREFLRCACSAAALSTLGLYAAACDSADPGDEENPPDPSGSGVTVNGNVITIDSTHTATQGLKTSGGFLLITSAHTIVINTDGQNLKAFTSVCTHQSCDVNTFNGSRIVCPCHGSQYDTSGQVTQGPAANPLKEYAVARQGNNIVVTKS